MPCPCPYILCLTFIRSSLCEVCFSLTFGVPSWWAGHLNSCWNRRTNIENLSDDPMMPNIEDLSDDPMIAMMIIALQIGRSSIDQSESRILASSQLEDLGLPKITSQILKTSLMIEWSRWWSLHCGLGGPASPATIRRPLLAGSKYIIASATMSCHHPHCQRHCHIHRHSAGKA